ncbi:DUF4276 family protein [Myroides odoratimimus]|uniref:DUF4276 family protein n=1 Tax=Myroides odoratimimus TaxID=76832 RepID=UPI0025762A75|nr:DUF4276 family protein [Myroides odoratimimus]MDM1093173.1 DUF4276 family protein [Myroides odoratimimus]MDM1527568.1 DUF4276 family protein [Myroides odoratimimus]
MKRLIVICEGETEQEFCKHILFQHLYSRGILLEHPLIKRSAGGIGSWDSLKKQVLGHLNEGGAFVSTFIDMYGIKDSYAFPNWVSSKSITDVKRRMEDVELAMEQEINHANFIGNIVVHEYETLLFSDISAIERIVPDGEVDMVGLNKIITSTSDIELINNGATTAPSKRLEKNIIGYVKTLYGHYIAEEIGLGTIRAKCVKFDIWISKLESI